MHSAGQKYRLHIFQTIQRAFAIPCAHRIGTTWHFVSQALIPLGAFQCLHVSWIGRPLLVVFVSRGRNLIITTALRWIDVALLVPDIFTEKGTGASKTTVSVLRANFFYMRCESSCYDWCFNFVRERPALEARRRNLWCLSGPTEQLSSLYGPSRTRLSLWLTELSIVFVHFGLVRISSSCHGR